MLAFFWATVLADATLSSSKWRSARRTVPNKLDAESLLEEE